MRGVDFFSCTQAPRDKVANTPDALSSVCSLLLLFKEHWRREKWIWFFFAFENEGTNFLSACI